MPLYSIPFYQRLHFKMETYSLDPCFAVGGRRLNFLHLFDSIQRHSLFLPPPPQASVVISTVQDVNQLSGRRQRNASFQEKYFFVIDLVSRELGLADR